MLTESGFAQPGAPSRQQRDSASPPSPRPPPGPGQPLQTGRWAAGGARPLSTPERRWGASGTGRGRPGRLPGGGGRQRREACEPPGPPGSTASPWSGAISRAAPGRQSGKEPEGGEGASRWPAALEPAGFPGGSVATPRPSSLRRQLAPCGLHAAGRTRGGGGLRPLGSQMVSPVGCRHSGLLRKRVGSVCVRPRDSQEPLPLAPAAGRVPGLSRLQPLPLELPPQGSSQGPGPCWPALPHDLHPGRLCVWDALLVQPCCEGPGARFLPQNCLAVPCILVPQASRSARQALLPEPEVPTAPSAPRLSPHHP